jgi:Cu/Ag efflux pump CusA
MCRGLAICVRGLTLLYPVAAKKVLMTALAMIIGMLPMAIEPGQNAPLGRAVIGGLMFATCATLILARALLRIGTSGPKSTG